MTIKQKVAIHLWWPGQGLSLPSHKNDSKSIKQQAEDREKAKYNIDQFFNQAETYARSRKTYPKSKTNFNPSWEAMIPFINKAIPLIIHADEIRQISSALDWAEKRKYRIIISEEGMHGKLLSELHPIKSQ